MIDGLSLQRVLTQLQRAQATAADNGRSSQQAQIAADGANAKATAASREQRQSGLQERVSAGIRGISPDDPHRRRRVLRVVIEASLKAEFGEELDADPAFHALVDQVAATVEDDPQLAHIASLALSGVGIPASS